MGRSTAGSAVLQAALVALAAAAAAAPGLAHGYVFDDHLIVAGNADLFEGRAPITAVFARRYWGFSEEVAPNELYRPLSVASLAITARLSGGAAAAHHAVNIALHAACAVLVLALARILTGSAAAGLVGGLLFAVHPVATEAVIPVSGRSDLLAALFLLGAAAAAAAAGRIRSRGGAAAAGVAVGACALLGALSKETAFVAPLTTALVALASSRGAAGGRAAPREDPRARGRRRARAAVLAAGAAAAVAAAVLMRLSALGYVVRVAAPSDEVAASMAFVDNPLATAPFVSRLLTALRVAAGAAGLLVFPAGLSADYSYDAVRVSTGLDGAEEAGALLAAALFAAALPLSARRSPAASAALAWAGLTYLPGSNLVLPSGTIFGERLLYVPLAGFAILAAEAARWAAGSGRLRRAAVAALAAAVVLILAARFWSRASDWSSDEALFRSAAAVHPGSVKARHNLGFALERAGRLEEAAAEYRAALRIAPWLVRTRMNLADCLAGSGKVEEAVAELEIAVESHPEVPYLSAALARAHYALGVRRHEEGRQDAFLAEMEAAVRYDPLHGPARYNLAVDALRRGDREAARLHAEAAIRAGYDLPPGFREAAGLAPPSP